MLPIFMILLCVVLRVVPHPPNFAPVGATAVMAGRTLPPWFGLAVVFVGMFLADVALAQIHGYAIVSSVTPFIYGGFAVQLLLGRVLRKRRGGAIGAAFLGACAFFVLSNFGVWALGDFSPTTPGGLVVCYAAALPFFGATLAGDVLWTAALSLLYAQVAKRVPDRHVPVRDAALI
jgi:hypothetical protein